MPGRIRSIKPELLEDEKAAALPDAAWRLFVSSWLLADDHGNFRAGDRYLAAHVWQDTRKIVVARGGLMRLANDAFIIIYEVNSERYAHIRSWRRHQRIDNAGKPRVPGLTTENHIDSARFAVTFGEPPQSTAILGGLPLDPDPDLRPPTPTTDQDLAAVRRIWDSFVARREERYPNGRSVTLSDARESSIKARLKDYGEERVMAALAKFFDPSLFWAAGDHAKRPELLFRSVDQFEKIEAASPSKAPGIGRGYVQHGGQEGIAMLPELNRRTAELKRSLAKDTGT